MTTSDRITVLETQLRTMKRMVFGLSALIAAGFLVGSNCDKAGASDEQNARRLEATLAAGTHFLSSDFPVAREKGGYALDLGGYLARCNPVTAPLDCIELEFPPLRVSPSGDEVVPPEESNPTPDKKTKR